jgi:hypothetical protein
MLAGRSHTVAVRKVALSARSGGPGESTEPPIARPRWHVAEGETLGLLPDGTIQISR